MRVFRFRSSTLPGKSNGRERSRPRLTFTSRQHPPCQRTARPACAVTSGAETGGFSGSGVMPDAFAPGPSQPSSASLFADAAPLDAEKLDAYRVALEFQAVAVRLVPKRGCAELRDQLDRASISIVLNIAEGCGRRSPADKGRFYSMARGSATECAAILDLLGVRGLVDDRVRRRARSLLVRVVQMLTRLVARMAASSTSQP